MASEEKTQKEWLGNTYLFAINAKVIRVGEGCVVLDRTIFHPQGGGQPSDSGTIKGVDREIVFTVSSVKNAGEEVEHHGSFGSDSQFSVREEVKVEIDEALRLLHARCHTAGHLLDQGLASLDTETKGVENLVPGKGCHFPGNCYVEYEGIVPEQKRESLRIALEERIAKLIEEGSEVLVQNLEYDEAKKVLGQVPSYFSPGQNIRVVSIKGEGCGCGGTHLKNVKEIGSLKVTKIRKVKKVTRVSYQISP